MGSPEAEKHLSNPPSKQTRMVKIRAVQAIRLMRDGNEHIVTPGSTVDVTEDEAKEFCDREFDLGYKDTFGNFDPHSVAKKKIRRAERVK